MYTVYVYDNRVLYIMLMYFHRTWVQRSLNRQTGASEGRKWRPADSVAEEILLRGHDVQAACHMPY